MGDYKEKMVQFRNPLTNIKPNNVLKNNKFKNPNPITRNAKLASIRSRNQNKTTQLDKDAAGNWTNIEVQSDKSNNRECVENEWMGICNDQTKHVAGMDNDSAKLVVIKYKALYNYETTDIDCLGFQTGDILLVDPNDPTDSGWIQATLNDVKGWIPENYVEKQVEEDTDKIQNIRDLEKNLVVGDKECRGDDEENKNIYEGNLESHVLNPQNDIVSESNCWNNVANSDGDNRYADNRTQHENNEWCTDPAWGLEGTTPSCDKENGQREVKYQALYNFDDSNPDSLAFNAGDIILVNPSDCADPGWLIGSLNGKVGWVPENYVELFGYKTSNEKSDEGVFPVTNEMGILSNNTESNAIKYQALFDYEGAEPESLAFNSGDIIVVNSQDTAEPGWLIGSLNGKIGWVPDNYVTLYDSTTDKENIISKTIAEQENLDILKNDLEIGMVDVATPNLNSLNTRSIENLMDAMNRRDSELGNQIKDCILIALFIFVFGIILGKAGF